MNEQSTEATDPRLSGTHVGMVRHTRLVHFVGIGGIGMSGIAEVLVNLGYSVRGSDMKPSDNTERLSGLGCDVRIGHAERNVEGADVVVVSSAVKSTNPEWQAAKRSNIPVIRRAEMLAELMRMKFGVAVGGTHGKTTVTSMLAAVLAEGGLDPTVVVGGKVNHLGTTAKLGQGPYLVAEADESDGSFLHLNPTIAVVTNIDPEHLDHYKGGMAEIRQTFTDFVNRIPFYGLAILCVDHDEVQAILPHVERRVTTYGLSPQAEFRARDLRFDGPKTSFELMRQGQSAGRFEVPMLGEHNVENALAVLTVAHELGVSDKAARRGLAGFDGVERRFSVRGEVGGVMVVDDYGHHPAEIRATLKGARRAYPDRRVVAAFQPHRYSRTEALLDDFSTAFNDAEVVRIAPVFAAGEAPRPGVDHDAVVRAVRARGHRDVDVVASVDDAVRSLGQTVRSGDLVIFFGAGDIGRAGRAMTAALQAMA